MKILGKATNTRGDGRNVGNKRSREFVARTSHLMNGKVTKCYRCVRQDSPL